MLRERWGVCEANDGREYMELIQIERDGEIRQNRMRSTQGMRMKMRKIPVNLSLKPALVEQAKRMAEDKGLSLSAWVSLLISAALNEPQFPDEKIESGETNSIERMFYPTVGRNDPCPCGSGKKFKQCHGKGLE